MGNPWKVFDSFKPMFCDTVTVTGRRPNSQSLSCTCTACVYPPSTIEQFTDEAEETKIVKQKILLARTGQLSCGFEPLVGDKVITEEGSMYVSATMTKHEWYDIEVRSKR